MLILEIIKKYACYHTPNAFNCTNAFSPHPLFAAGLAGLGCKIRPNLSEEISFKADFAEDRAKSALKFLLKLILPDLLQKHPPR